MLAAQADLTFICSPNNPSATVAPVKDSARLASGLRGIFVIDEAYTDFADENAMGLVTGNENVIVLRTVRRVTRSRACGSGLPLPSRRRWEGLISIKDSYSSMPSRTGWGLRRSPDQAWEKIKTPGRL